MSDPPEKQSQQDRKPEATVAQSELDEAEARVTNMLRALSGNARLESNSEEPPAPPKNPPSQRQLQLPMFLSKTYHMIGKCDPNVATWSDSGDNFVVKNLDVFSSEVLPLYFKHSNFSSFARQLNFYGFRKLRSDPILTSDVDPRKSSFVRFFHENFQRDRPDLLQNIKRATKSDQQSRDEVDQLKAEVSQLKETVSELSNEMESKLSEMSREFNRRINTVTEHYERLVELVQVIAGQATQQQPAPPQAPPQEWPHSSFRGQPTSVDLIRSLAAMSSPQSSDLLLSLTNSESSSQNIQQNQPQNSAANLLRTLTENLPPTLPPPSTSSASATSDLVRSLAQVATIQRAAMLFGGSSNSAYSQQPHAGSGNRKRQGEDTDNGNGNDDSSSRSKKRGSGNR